MQCGPIRFHLSAKKAAESSPLEHKVFPRITDFGWSRPENETAIQDIYAALIVSQERNDLIVRDLQQALSSGRSPLVLTSSIKGKVKKKHISVGWDFSCFAAHLIERDLC